MPTAIETLTALSNWFYKLNKDWVSINEWRKKTDGYKYNKKFDIIVDFSNEGRPSWNAASIENAYKIAEEWGVVFHSISKKKTPQTTLLKFKCPLTGKLFGHWYPGEDTSIPSHRTSHIPWFYAKWYYIVE